jgi:hypothetical protein
MDKDGNNTIEIAENIKNYFYIENDKIYYTTQDRKMYSINIDGTNQTQLVEGRKFVNQISKNYLLYRDYANQEAIHILNLETNEENFIGYFGQIYNFQGKIYVNARKRSDDGSLEDEFTLFKVTENGSLQEIGQVAKFGTDIKYITYKGYAYIYNQQEGSSIINLETKQKEETDKIDGCRFFVAGYGYKLDDSNLEDIKIEKVEI